MTLDAPAQDAPLTDPVDILAADLAERDQLDWESLIIADWPTYSVSGWPTERHQPLAPGLPAAEWCSQVRDRREKGYSPFSTSAKEVPPSTSEERAKSASMVGFQASQMDGHVRHPDARAGREVSPLVRGPSSIAE
jgi:hypothetical protein